MNPIERTSSGGTTKPTSIWLCAPIIFAAATLTSASNIPESAVSPQRTARTDAGLARKEEAEQTAGVGELRRLSSLTWGQIAALFRVSRRAVHHWASGKPMTAEHETHLQKVLSHLQALHRGSAQPSRAMLFAPAVPEGQSLFDLLAARDYPRAAALAETASLGAPVRSQAMVYINRMPPKPESLISTVEELFDIKPGPRQRTKAVRVKRA